MKILFIHFDFRAAKITTERWLLTSVEVFCNLPNAANNEQSSEGRILSVFRFVITHDLIFGYHHLFNDSWECDFVDSCVSIIMYKHCVKYNLGDLSSGWGVFIPTKPTKSNLQDF